MKATIRAFYLSTVVALGASSAYADSWAPPTEQDYASENGQFLAHVTPAKGEVKAQLVVYRVRDSEKNLLWQCTLGNEGAPQEVFLSDDGQQVATVNEWSRRVHGGMGDYVVAFYSPAGLVRNYSLEQVLHYPDTIDRKKFHTLMQRSSAGRSWSIRPMFFDAFEGKLYFCVWLLYGRKWIAWDATTGTEIAIQDKLVKRWDAKGQRWAREKGVKSKHYFAALEVLNRLKAPKDREAIESLLDHGAFYTSYEKKAGKFVQFYSCAVRRAMADKILTEWDGRAQSKWDPAHQHYSHLGVVHGTVKLPRPPGDGDGGLCVYLIPGAKAKEDRHSQLPVHRLLGQFGRRCFSGYEPPGGRIAFSILGVTPGTYTVEAVWDKAMPFTFGRDSIKGPPQDGDYVTTSSLSIRVRAGEAVKVAVSCTQPVTKNRN